MNVFEGFPVLLDGKRLANVRDALMTEFQIDAPIRRCRIFCVFILNSHIGAVHPKYMIVGPSSIKAA